MPPGTLDAILNFAIPFVIIVGMLFLIYKSAKEPIDQLVGWIKRMIMSGKDKAVENAPMVYSEIIYE